MCEECKLSFQADMISPMYYRGLVDKSKHSCINRCARDRIVSTCSCQQIPVTELAVRADDFFRRYQNPRAEKAK